MVRILALAALLSVAACGQHGDHAAASNQSANTSTAPTESAAAEGVPSLEGEWRVASIDGRPVGSEAMTVNFSGGKASIASGCVRRGLTYTQKKNVVSFAADPGGSSNCERQGTSAEHETAYAAIEGASIAIFGKGGAEVALSGNGGNLALERR